MIQNMRFNCTLSTYKNNCIFVKLLKPTNFFMIKKARGVILHKITGGWVVINYLIFII